MNRSKLMIVGLGVATGVVAPRACQWVGNNRRVRRTIHVAMGRPIAYKVILNEGQIHVSLSNTLVEDCTMTVAPPAIDVSTLRAAVDDLIANVKVQPSLKVEAVAPAVNNVTVRDSVIVPGDRTVEDSVWNNVDGHRP